MSVEIIDASALAKLKDMIGGDIDDLSELVEDFVDAFPEQAKTMQDQAATSDWEGLRISAHTLKSNARDMGASGLSALAAELESQCKEGAPTDAVSKVVEIVRDGEAAVRTLQKLDLNSV